VALSDEIKERLDIVDVVSGYLPSLKKAGRYYKAQCPFHGERTPSFVVFPERQSWRCFGACSRGGDVLSFVMGVEKLEFGDAVKLLAHRAGVAIERYRRASKAPNILHKINEAAATFFQDLLRSQQGVAARAYLNKRGVDSTTSDHFRLGLSSGRKTALVEHLHKMGYSQEEVVSAGLASSFDDATYRDMFIGRLIFPIHDDQGSIAGFGGRSLDGIDPKYLNTPRTDVFDKGHILYAFHMAKSSIKDSGEGVIVEGYMDAIAAHQFGFTNVVASMGTALTEEQVKLLRRVGQSFVLAMDPDFAGQEATFRSLESSWRVFEKRVVGGSKRNLPIYQRTNVSSLKIALLPADKDPDTVIRDGADLWTEVIDKSLSLLDYLFMSAPARWDLKTSEGKAHAAEQLYPLIAEMELSFDQESYFRKLADTLGVKPATLEASLGRPRRELYSGSARKSTLKASSTPFESDRRDRLEEHLLALLLRWPGLRERVNGLDPHVLEQWENREIFTLWMGCSVNGGIIGDLLGLLEEDMREQVNHLLTLTIPPMDLRQRGRAILECSRRLEERRLRKMKVEEATLLSGDNELDRTAVVIDGDIGRQAVDTNDRLRRIFHERASGYSSGG
jgi:DNA primase